MNNVVLVSDVQQSDSVTHIHVSNCRLFSDLDYYRALSSLLRYAVGPYLFYT